MATKKPKQTTKAELTNENLTGSELEGAFRCSELGETLGALPLEQLVDVLLEMLVVLASLEQPAAQSDARAPTKRVTDSPVELGTGPLRDIDVREQVRAYGYGLDRDQAIDGPRGVQGWWSSVFAGPSVAPPMLHASVLERGTEDLGGRGRSGRSRLRVWDPPWP